MRTRNLSLPGILACLCLAAPALVRAENAAGTQPATAEPAPREQASTQPADAGVTIAILDFESDTPATPDLGKQISEVLMASLSGEQGFQLVDRSAMGKILLEHEVNLSGLVDPSQATRIGKLVGARIIITGKAFPVDNQVFITAKLIGTETSLVAGIIVKGPKSADTADLLMELSQKIAQRLRSNGPKLLAADDAVADPMPGLKAKLATRKLPKINVNIPEHHLTPVTVIHIDPAVETEVKNILISAGFTVIEGTAAELDRSGVEVCVTGEAFSEFNARIGNLISCSGRVELKATTRKDGQVLFSNRTTTRAVDLGENVAGKAALQKGGRELAIKLLQHFADTLPALPPETQPAKAE
jgi:TolB-like protein